MKFKNLLLKRQQKRKSRRIEPVSEKVEDGNDKDLIINYESEPHTMCTRGNEYYKYSIDDDVVQMRNKSGSNFRERHMMTQSLTTESTSELAGCRWTTTDLYELPNYLSSAHGMNTNGPKITNPRQHQQRPSSPTCDNFLNNSYEENSTRLSPHVHYNSLPYYPVQPDHLIDNVQYNSLPSSLTQSCYVSPSRHIPSHRSRIRTNPWLPLPKAADEYCRRDLCSNAPSKPEPRLSRFISEVEEIMREQCVEESLPVKCLSCSAESLASSCCTATEIPEKHQDVSPLRSPSEGYKSACDSDCCSEGINSYSSSDKDGCLSTSLSSIQTDDDTSTPKCSPPTLKDFQLSISQENTTPLMHSSMTNEMCANMTISTSSLKSEDLQQRVRKLCQSTSQLDEKIRLARLESSYIQVK